MKLLFTCISISFLFSSLAFSRRDVKSHVHGEAKVTIVVEKNNVQLEAEIPMSDLVSFEHEPKTKEQKKQWTTALNKLKDANRVVSLTKDAKCSSVKITLKDPHAQDDHYDHHGKNKKKDDDDHNHHDSKKSDEKHHGHEKEKDDHHGHEKEKDDHHSHDHEEEHADVLVNYVFSCKKVGELSKVDIKLFKEFKSLKKINASFVSSKRQGFKSLSPSSSSIDLNK
ncbi:MAG: DUF2796 domain-containing protein [Oligoflexales bacterium]